MVVFFHFRSLTIPELSAVKKITINLRHFDFRPLMVCWYLFDAEGVEILFLDLDKSGR